MDLIIFREFATYHFNLSKKILKFMDRFDIHDGILIKFKYDEPIKTGIIQSIFHLKSIQKLLNQFGKKVYIIKGINKSTKDPAAAMEINFFRDSRVRVRGSKILRTRRGLRLI